VPGHAAGRTVATASNLDCPADSRELSDRGIEPLAGDLDVMARFSIFRAQATKPRQFCDGKLLSLPIPQHQHAGGCIDSTTRRIVGLDKDPAVLKPDSAREPHPLLPPAAGARTIRLRAYRG
jgi:hypothetical protein